MKVIEVKDFSKKKIFSFKKKRIFVRIKKDPSIS